jgi:hypothetical protein
VSEGCGNLAGGPEAVAVFTGDGVIRLRYGPQSVKMIPTIDTFVFINRHRLILILCGSGVNMRFVIIVV